MRNRRQRRAEAAQTQKAPDPFKIYMNAERYRIADVVLRRAFEDPLLAASIGGPSLVMSAFASELYLKCLYALETGRAAGRQHDLRTLFLLLAENTRAEIELRWNEYCATPQRETMYRAIDTVNGAAVPRDLRWSLKQGSDGFVALRYMHETEKMETKFLLGDFHTIVRDVILNRMPNWGAHIHGPMIDLSAWS